MTLSPEEVVFVGDTLTDIETGKQAGSMSMRSHRFCTKTELSERKPRRILKNLKELLRAVEGLFIVKAPFFSPCALRSITTACPEIDPMSTTALIPKWPHARPPLNGDSAHPNLETKRFVTPNLIFSTVSPIEKF